MINFTRLILDKGGLSSRLHRKHISCLVVWNITKRCNLNCKHCYVSARGDSQEEELSTREAKKVIDALVRMNVGVLLFSGGEPLLREDIFELIAYAKERGIKPVLSSNGTFISPRVARNLKSAGVVYVGVSIDGDKKIHNQFRGKRCFEKTLEGLDNCKEIGVPVGIRFTLNKFNYKSLPRLIDLAIEECIPRFCMYHLVYSGRATKTLDIGNKTRRKIIDYLISKTLEIYNHNLEILTVDNPADGVYLYKYISSLSPRRGLPVLEELLLHHGRCSAGERILAISHKGDVFACQFWNHRSVGNLRRRDLYDIWLNSQNRHLYRLRNKEEYLKGKCGICNYKKFCGGCRLRAKVVLGDVWQEDPSCYLTKKEVTDGIPLVKNASFTKE